MNIKHGVDRGMDIEWIDAQKKHERIAMKEIYQH